MAGWRYVLIGVLLAVQVAGPLLGAAQAREWTFPETGQTVREPFLTVWETSGGLERHGFPISAEIAEDGRLVQYFERSRFERAVDQADPAGGVGFAALGRSLYDQRYPATVFVPAAAPAGALPGEGRRDFPETGLAVQGAFLGAWERLGGQPSVGLPISPVFREGARIVQYFERARFEYHPAAAGTSAEVQLGALGRLTYGRAYSASQAPVPVTTSISILGDFIGQVGGDKVGVTPLVPAGQEPHEFEPTPQDAVAVAQSRLFVANGLGLEAWLADLVRDAGGRDTRVITLSQGLPVLGQGGPHPEMVDGNPHLWLDVTLAMAYVMTIRDTLSELDPANGPTYDANAARYLALLRDLDHAIGLEIGKLPPAHRTLVTFHDAWPYFCARYGLTNLPVLQANPEGELSAAEYAELVEMIRREQPKAIFGEAGFNPKLVRQLARDTGVPFVDGLHGDTLSVDGLPATYVGMMQFDISLIVSSLQ